MSLPFAKKDQKSSTLVSGHLFLPTCMTPQELGCEDEKTSQHTAAHQMIEELQLVDGIASKLPHCGATQTLRYDAKDWDRTGT